MRLKALVIGLMLGLAASSSAFAQCTGNPAAGRICANVGAAPALPGWATGSDVLDRNFGAPSVQGTILNRGASSWSATAAPVLGLNGASGGSLQLRGATSGGATISVAAAAGSVNFRLPITNGSANQVLITDGSGNTSWTNAGAGTVSSVGLSMPAIFSVSGSPVVGAGTLTATLATQSANLVWAGPTTGAASAPAFRSLVGADLPNPSSSTLGGVQSFAAVSSQWIRQISTSGVPTASQPAFSDISGTLSPAQCPNPSASSIGCVQSFALQASKWISSISTLGVPSATQPSFSDISGTVSPSQLPSIGNNSVLGNNSGGTAIPIGITASNVLDMIGSTQGQILYRGASGWSVLGVGTGGQVLTTNGAAANPSWTTVTGTGTVTSVATGTGLTGGPVTTTGTISFASVGSNTVLANITGGSAAPIPNTMTSILDATLGSTQGNILYRGASNWTVLAPGTNGQVLTQGASTPSWASAGTVSNVTISTAAGIASTGSCTITTTGTCTLTPYFEPGTITNCTLVASTPGGALTVALKTKAGSDPSASSPCTISFRNATVATGDYTPVNVTAATSVALGATGSTLGAAGSSTPFRVWVTAWNNAGTVVLGLSNQSSAGQIFPLDEAVVQSSTACNGCTNATSAGVFYTTAAQTSVPIRIIGYLDFETGLATAGIWGTNPQHLVMMGPGVRKPGDVIQEYQVNSITPVTSSSPTYQPTVAAKNFTKASAANIIWLDAGGPGLSNSAGGEIRVAVHRGSAACTTLLSPIAIGDGGLNIIVAASTSVLDMPIAGGTTAANYTLCFSSAASVSTTFPYSANGYFHMKEIQG